MRATLAHTEGYVDRDGIALHYEVYGDGPKTIVFVPTWSFVHSRAYKAQIPYFSERFRCITWDPRGNGKSDRPITPDRYQLRDYVGDVIAVLDATSTASAVILGWSLSSGVAAAVAAYHPERVDALVSIGTVSSLASGYEYKTWEKYNRPQGDEPVHGWAKYNRDHWLRDYPDFVDFFASQIFNEPHSTKQIEDTVGWANQTDGKVLAATMDPSGKDDLIFGEAEYRRISCPVLTIHGDGDAVTKPEASEIVADLTNGEYVKVLGAGHAPHCRFPALVNTKIRDFLADSLGTWSPARGARKSSQKRVLYLSSPIGLGHARRDLAISRSLRAEIPGLQVDWLAQDPVTRFLSANNETLHPGSKALANESSHIESEAGEHDLNAFQAIRRMDEILIKNFMVFQEALEDGHYDLVIADEAWDVDHYWHEHPELKQAQVAWLTDFVGWVPMPEGGDHEAFLTSDYNAEMIGHVEQNPGVRDRSIFVGNERDIAPLGFGPGLPDMRDWVPDHFEFSGYVLGRHPDDFGPRGELRRHFGWREDEEVVVVSVGGSGVGGGLIRRILSAFPVARRQRPGLRMIVVTGPRLDPASFHLPAGAEAFGFVPDLDQRLAACDLAVVQGGLTTTMELAAAGTPFLYFPLKNHFEQNVHVAHRLDQYGAGRKMIYAESGPDVIAEAMIEELKAGPRAANVESNGATRAAAMLAELL